MIFSKNNLLRIKHDWIIHFNFLLFVVKICVTFTLCWGLKNFLPFKSFWPCLFLIILSLIIDSLLILLKPGLFSDIVLTKAEQEKYAINSHEFSEHLCFSSKVRLSRTLLMTFLVLVSCPIPDWQQRLPAGLIIGFFLIDPLIKYLFNIKTPRLYPPAHPSCSVSTLELRRFDSNFAGTEAWNIAHGGRTSDYIRIPRI